jgi:hypothetical protein
MKYVIVDVSNQVHRAKHAVGKRVPTGSTFDPFGVMTSDEDELRVGMILDVVFGGMINSFLRFGGNHCVAAFDMRSWRRDVAEDYKANRRDKIRTPEEERDQELIARTIDELRDFLRDYTNVTVLEADGAEADDFIARWVQLHQEPDDINIIVSADGDFKQLVRSNVDLYNPMTSTMYTIDGIFYQDGRKPKPSENTVSRHGQEWKVKIDPKTKVPETFNPAWELFEKCIRGDIGDNIRAAWPRVRTEKMKAAFNGSVLEWNNFINSTWGVDGEKHSVRELYEHNKLMIDLTAQPDEVKAMMDDAIVMAVERPPARMVGAHFARFCSRHRLTKILQQAEKYTAMLSRGYPHD